MRFYREKCLLALMENLENWVSSIKIQKLMFLLSERQDERSYDFMPYKFGCYSMQLSRDLRKLLNEGYLITNEIDPHQYKISRADFGFEKKINETDTEDIKRIIKRFGKWADKELIKYTYLQYPFFAINSIMAKDILSPIELKIINKHRLNKEERCLFTIGYEGRSLEKYIVELLKNGVKVLCDVRKNAFSQKFGFSKAQLLKACEGTGISYIHLPNLGIISEKRKNLENQDDYDILFKEYECTVLENSKAELNIIFQLLQNEKRVALTCYERDFHQCHRSRVAQKLMSIRQCNYLLENI